MHLPAVRQSVEYLALGHVTADVGTDGVATPGGAVYYAAAVASSLGLRTGVVTRTARDFPADDCPPGVSCHVVASDSTTTFSNLYDEHGSRTQRLLELAPPLEPGDVPPAWRKVGVLHIAPVVHEVGPEVAISIEADFVGLTPQGWLRTIDIGRPVRPVPWGVPQELVERADAIVLSEEDLGGDESRLPWLSEHVPLVVITRGGDGAHAFVDGSSVFQPAVAANATHPTGAGDSFAAALFARLWEGTDVSTAMRFAAAAAAYAIEHAGPARLPDRGAIERRGDEG